jgi:uncharacterized protein YcgI (DUF1989 family)
MPTPLYQPGHTEALAIDRQRYHRLATDRGRQLVERFVVPIRSGRSWTLGAGQICRLVEVEGPQVVDFNAWNRHDSRERFWAARTRQLHGTHLKVFDRLWSTLPYLRPIATVLGDTINYGFDADGAGCHDLLGTRCDPYVHRMLTGEDLDVCCHSNLYRAVAPRGLTEADVHDVLNVFQVTGLTADDHRYFVKPCPARAGDYFELFAEIDLLCAVSTCPHGDMSVPVWGPNAVPDATSICRPVAIEIYQPAPELLDGWSTPAVAEYGGSHGLSR